MLTSLQQAKLARLASTAAGDLSDKQLSKLAKLRAKAAADVSARKRKAVEAPASSAPAAAAPAAATATAAAPAAKRVYKEQPCRDQGHWGADGEWEYPADKELVCSTCQATFTFSGTDQAWFAKRELYAPARCAECIASKKAARHQKLQAGVSSTRCFNCGKEGHAASACPEQKHVAKVCYACGSAEHLSRNCPHASAKKAARGCFTCGSSDHMSRECPQRPPPVCFNCGHAGHGQKACPEPMRTSGACFAFAKGQCFSKKCKFAHVET
jgi:hypothetical protein